MQALDQAARGFPRDALNSLSELYATNPAHIFGRSELLRLGFQLRAEAVIREHAEWAITYHAQEGRPEQACEVYRTTRSTFPEFPWRERPLVQALLSADKRGDAHMVVDATKVLLALFPQSQALPKAIFVSARAQEANGRFDLVRRSLNLLIKTFPFDPLAELARNKLEQLPSDDASEVAHETGETAQHSAPVDRASSLAAEATLAKRDGLVVQPSDATEWAVTTPLGAQSPPPEPVLGGNAPADGEPKQGFTAESSRELFRILGWPEAVQAPVSCPPLEVTVTTPQPEQAVDAAEPAAVANGVEPATEAVEPEQAVHTAEPEPAAEAVELEPAVEALAPKQEGGERLTSDEAESQPTATPAVSPPQAEDLSSVQPALASPEAANDASAPWPPAPPQTQGACLATRTLRVGLPDAPVALSEITPAGEVTIDAAAWVSQAPAARPSMPVASVTEMIAVLSHAEHVECALELARNALRLATDLMLGGEASEEQRERVMSTLAEEACRRNRDARAGGDT